MSEGLVTHSGSSLPAIVILNVLSATLLILLSSLTVNALIVNLYSMFETTYCGTPCADANPLGLPSITPLRRTCMPAGNSPAIIV